MKATWKREGEMLFFRCPFCFEENTFKLLSPFQSVLDSITTCTKCNKMSKILPYGDVEKKEEN